MRLARACAVLGGITALLAIIGAVTAPRCGDDRGLGPVVALELSVNASEVGALVSSPECRAALRDNTFGDMLVFIPSFTAFLVLAALMLGRSLVVVPFVLGALSDQLEDVAMLRVLGEPSPEWLRVLFFASRIKFTLLSLGVLALAVKLVRTERVLGGVVLVGAVVAVAAPVVSHRVLMPGTLVAWIGLLIVALKWRAQ